MILPTKHLSGRRALIGLGAQVLSLLKAPKTFSRLWDEFKIKERDSDRGAGESSRNLRAPSVTYDWFVLALDLLFAFGIIELKRGKIRKTQG